MNSIRKIIHIDMDCFFAAVEVKHNPKLKGKPIAVGGHPDRRGVISTSSYEARQFGVRSAMPSSRALRLCPQLILIPPHFSLYEEESEHIRRIFQDYTDLIEPLSLDEAFLDVTGTTQCRGSATLIAKEIKKRVANETGLSCSAGVAPNKFLAKIASDWRKPNGLTVITPEKVDEFLLVLPVDKIHGVGKVTAGKMEQLGIHTCADLRLWEIRKLMRHFGKMGEYLYEIARGIDHRPVESNWSRKSLTVEHTFAKDIVEVESCLKRVPELFYEFESRMAEIGERYTVKGLVVKVKFFDFQQTTLERSRVLQPDIDVYREMFKEAIQRENKPVRLLGLGVRLKEKGEEEILQLSLPLE